MRSRAWVAVLAVLVLAGCECATLEEQVTQELVTLRAEMPVYVPVQVVLYPCVCDGVCVSPYWGYQILIFPGRDWRTVLRHEWEHAAGVRAADAPAETVYVEAN